MWPAVKSSGKKVINVSFDKAKQLAHSFTKLGKDQKELPIMKRFALHAKQISFKINPESSITIEAPYPKDFATLLKLLDKFDK